jgi:hypothetical protein
VRIRQVRDTDAPVEPAIAPPQMPADPPLRCFRVRVIAVVEHHQLDVAEDPLYGITAVLKGMRTSKKLAKPVNIE